MAKAREIDFGGVPKEIRKGGSGSHIPEDDYLFKIIEAEYMPAKGDKGAYYRWKFQVAKGELKGKAVYANTSLKTDALWNLRNLIYAALGKNVAGNKLKFDPTKLYGKIVAATATDNEYESGGKQRISTNLVDFRPKDELKADSDEDEEETEEEETEEETEEEELEEVDVDEL